MKNLIFLISVLLSFNAFAETGKSEWNGTSLSDETIASIQKSQYDYKKCISDEMQKASYQNQDSRRATDEIMKQCESTLAKMREVYTEAKVPGVVADRHLRQLRLQTTRTALQEMMYMEASRKAGQAQ